MGDPGNWPLGFFVLAAGTDVVSWIVGDSVDPLRQIRDILAYVSAALLAISPMIQSSIQVSDPARLAGGARQLSQA
jgi:hypothetical protein